MVNPWEFFNSNYLKLYQNVFVSHIDAIFIPMLGFALKI